MKGNNRMKPFYKSEIHECCPHCKNGSIEKMEIAFRFKDKTIPVSCKCDTCGYSWGERK